MNSIWGQALGSAGCRQNRLVGDKHAPLSSQVWTCPTAMCLVWYCLHWYQHSLKTCLDSEVKTVDWQWDMGWSHPFLISWLMFSLKELGWVIYKLNSLGVSMEVFGKRLALKRGDSVNELVRPKCLWGWSNPSEASMEPKAVEGGIHSLCLLSCLSWGNISCLLFSAIVESWVSLALRPSDSGIRLLHSVTMISHNDHGILWKEGLIWGLRFPRDNSPHHCES